ncbi:hypothetical protein QJS10_CPB14g01428 [Acorus calamus]|uniref:Uncharacterized protein n=1 Tax=Acorus calamus TaxID=4465 RepID=A0AAV9DF61_ACOCL|nr:hypothetical protein QJS10_CPB14g01428 [Acorus calamus]
MSESVNSLRNSNVRPLPGHIRPRECRCKKGECPIYTSRQEHSKGRRFYCYPFNRQTKLNIHIYNIIRKTQKQNPLTQRVDDSQWNCGWD